MRPISERGEQENIQNLSISKGSAHGVPAHEYSIPWKAQKSVMRRPRTGYQESYQWVEGVKWEKKTGRQSQKGWRKCQACRPGAYQSYRQFYQRRALDGPFCYHGCASELSIRCGLPLLSLAVTPRSYVLRS